MAANRSQHPNYWQGWRGINAAFSHYHCLWEITGHYFSWGICCTKDGCWYLRSIGGVQLPFQLGGAQIGTLLQNVSKTGRKTQILVPAIDMICDHNILITDSSWQKNNTNSKLTAKKWNVTAGNVYFSPTERETAGFFNTKACFAN